MLDGVHPRLQGRRNGAVAVRMRHNGKSGRVGQLDHPADVLRLRARLRQDAEVVKIDEAGDHELDEVRPLLPCLVQQGAVFVLRVEAAADEGPIVPAAVDGKGWTAVIDAVFPRQLPRPQADAPGVPAVAQEADPARLIIRQPRADEAVKRMLLLRVDGGAIIHAVEDHMDMQIAEHGFSSRNIGGAAVNSSPTRNIGTLGTEARLTGAARVP